MDEDCWLLGGCYCLTMFEYEGYVPYRGLSNWFSGLVAPKTSSLGGPPVRTWLAKGRSRGRMQFASTTVF